MGYLQPTVKCLPLTLIAVTLQLSESLAAPLASDPDAGDGVVFEPSLSADERRDRAALIRDAAASVGMTNGVLLAGIAQAETGLAHCWSEATWACEGPPSSSCGGGGVIAGSADGPCSARQGGLGMFQFDSGTYDDTIARYGEDIVTVEGNTAAVVPFLVERAIQSVDGVSSEDDALNWMNAIPVQDGDPEFEAWLYFVAWRYNGCMGCTSVQQKYRNATHEVMDEFGADFWATAGSLPSCDVVPPVGRIVEEDERCFKGGGNGTFWKRAEAGHGGQLRWTLTTDSDRVDNYGVWTFDFVKAGTYEVAVYTDGGEFGQSTQARYEITHAGQTETVTIDQRAAEGFQSLGVFEFAEGADQSVRLNDNTGEPYAEDGTRLMFDAVRIAPPGGDSGDGGDDDGDDDETEVSHAFGGCTTPGQGAPSYPLLAGLMLIALGARRRRR